MAIRVGARDVAAHFSEYLGRTANSGERIIVESHGEPVAALVSLDDLHRLEATDSAQTEAVSEFGPEDRFRQELERSGIVVHYPAREAVPPRSFKLVKVSGEPVSEQILADRR